VVDVGNDGHVSHIANLVHQLSHLLNSEVNWVSFYVRVCLM
jgi:hypothetical protein